MRINNLVAENDYERAVLNYLEENASDILVAKINKGEKTLGQCLSFCKNEAKKFAKNGIAMIDDKTVYGWAVHFFEEDSIKPGTVPKPQTAAASKPVQKPVEKVEKKPAKPQPTDECTKNQMSIFDLLGAQA